MNDDQVQNILDSTEVEDTEPMQKLGESIIGWARDRYGTDVDSPDALYEAVKDRVGDDALVEVERCPKPGVPEHCNDGTGVIIKEKNGTRYAIRCICHPGYEKHGIYFWCNRRGGDNADPVYYSWDSSHANQRQKGDM